jgi:putative flippase GtrA
MTEASRRRSRDRPSASSRWSSGAAAGRGSPRCTTCPWTGRSPREGATSRSASLARIPGEPSAAAESSIALARARFGRALRRPHNWVQLAKFCTVGATGYIVNLSVYTALLLGAGLDYRLAATCSFLVAVTNNYTWNRLWTFRGERGHVAYQGMRFLVVSLLAYLGNLIWLTGLVSLGLHKVLAQAIAIILVTPFNFAGNKLWSFRRD